MALSNELLKHLMENANQEWLSETSTLSTPPQLPLTGPASHINEHSVTLPLPCGGKKEPLSAIDEMLGDWSERYAISYIPTGGLESMKKKDYEKLAAAVRDMRAGFNQAVTQAGGTSTDELIEIVIARLGLVLAKDNTSFNSFLFEAVCKGNKS